VPASAVGGQTSPSRPTFRSGVDPVTADVTVLRAQRDPIDTLTADDFTLLVDGAARPIVSMRHLQQHDTGGDLPPPQVALPAPDDEAQRRVFVLVVDREHVNAGEGQQMLEAAARFVDNLPIDDRVALWTLPQSTEPLRFNEDREALRKRLLLSVGTFRPPLGPWMVGRDEAILADENRPGVMDGIIARECYKQPQTCPSQVEVQVREVARDARQRTDATLSGLADLIAAIAPIEGPKQLVLVTGGPVRTFDNLGTISDIATRASLARVTVHALQVAEPSYQARTDQMRAAPAEVDQSASAAYLLATTTGGLAITPSSGNVAFSQLSRELSVAYALAFETQPGDRDGRVHQIHKVADRGWAAASRARRSFRVDPIAATTPR
jgi:VWFA-related protein